MFHRKTKEIMYWPQNLDRYEEGIEVWKSIHLIGPLMKMMRKKVVFKSSMADVTSTRKFVINS